MNFLILFLAFCSTVTAWACDERDPFSEEEKPLPLVPREAFFLAGTSALGDTNDVEVIVRNLMFLPYELSGAPQCEIDLTKFDDVDSSDELLDLSRYFPNCKKGLWVVYNKTSCKVIAKVDLALRVSVNEYVARCKMKFPSSMRLSATYMTVDKDVPLNIDAIRDSEYKTLMKFSGVFKAGEEMTFLLDKDLISIDLIDDDSRKIGYLSLTLFRENAFDVETRMSMEAGREIFVEVGLTDGGEKDVLCLKLEWVDMMGETIESHMPRAEAREEKYDFLGSLAICLQTRDLGVFYGYERTEGRLLVPFSSAEGVQFKKNDIVYDLRDFFERQGIRVKRGDWVVMNQSTQDIYTKCSAFTLEQLEEMRYEYTGPRYPYNLELTSTFYEVDYQMQGDGEWTVERLLSARPKLVGRLGVMSMGGECMRLKSKLGNISLETIMDDYGELDINGNFDLMINGERIIKKVNRKCYRGKMSIIELDMDAATKRSVVMLLEWNRKVVGKYRK